jgi:trehalose 6-phosphate synthase/phosphatase
MNLVPYEYVVCRQGLEDSGNKNGSMLVVSEFVGCTPSLSGALRINPWNVEDTADHLYRAITMSQHEVRRTSLRSHIHLTQHKHTLYAVFFRADALGTLSQDLSINQMASCFYAASVCGSEKPALS